MEIRPEIPLNTNGAPREPLFHHRKDLRGHQRPVREYRSATVASAHPATKTEQEC